MSRSSATVLNSPAVDHDDDDALNKNNNESGYGNALGPVSGGVEKNSLGEGRGGGIYTRSAPHSRFASRQHSRAGSRAGSRVDLGMMKVQLGALSRAQSHEVAIGKGVEGMEPDFVDLDERDLELEERDLGSVDEGEMRRLVMGRVGGWVDWMVGWMDFRASDDEESGEVGDVVEEGEGVEEAVDDGSRKGERIREDDTAGLERRVDIVPAPGAGGGAWDDAKWLLRIAADSL